MHCAVYWKGFLIDISNPLVRVRYQKSHPQCRWYTTGHNPDHLVIACCHHTQHVPKVVQNSFSTIASSVAIVLPRFPADSASDSSMACSPQYWWSADCSIIRSFPLRPFESLLPSLENSLFGEPCWPGTLMLKADKAGSVLKSTTWPSTWSLVGILCVSRRSSIGWLDRGAPGAALGIAPLAIHEKRPTTGLFHEATKWYMNKVDHYF